jgi:hypothetical protein
MIEYPLSLSRALALRGRFHDACRLVAPYLPTLSIIGSRSAAVPARTATEPVNRIVVAHSQLSRHNAVPDSAPNHTGCDIAAEDWDLLFRAALELLAYAAAEKPPQEGTGLQLQAPGTAFRECLAALDQLRRSVPPIQQSPMRQTPINAGEIASLGGTCASGADS